MSNAFNLSQLANNTNSTGQVSLTAGVTGTLPIANGGTGSTSTTFVNAATNVTGTLPVANGGTGAATLTANNVILGNGTSAPTFVAPSTTGNVLTSNGTTWTSVAPSGGGVTSLNSQTGAVVNTTQYAIGSYVMGRPANSYTSYNNSTIAGSSLYAASSTNNYTTSYNEQGQGTSYWYFSGSTSLVNTGSWRCVSIAGYYPTGTDTTGQNGLWVRYA
jgi:hypothetical protein